MDENIDNFTILRLRISTRQKTLFFPIDGRDLMEAVGMLGYEITAPPLPPGKAGQRLTFSGNFARKNGVTLDTNINRGVLGITADSYALIIKSFNELTAIIQNKFNVDLEKGSRFFEIIAEMKFDSKNNPLESIANILKRNRSVSKISTILNQDVSIYTLQFVTKGKVPNQEDWLDITITPDILMPNRRYAISAIFRNKDKAVVERFGEHLMSNLLEIIKTIEA
jgi:hypothetical protein